MSYYRGSVSAGDGAVAPPMRQTMPKSPEQSYYYGSGHSYDARFVEQAHQPVHSAPPRRSRKKRWIIILVLLAVVAALGVGLGVGLSQKSEKDNVAGTDFPGSTVPFGQTVAGQDESEQGMRESGSYRTSYNSGLNQKLEWQSGDVRFGNNGGSVEIAINSTATGATIDGFGAALTDATASLLTNLKNTNATLYNQTMKYLFNRRIGYSIIRVPIGTTDFSPQDLQYTFADQQGAAITANSTDTIGPLSNFNTNGAQRFIFPILRDALRINSALKISILPWSPPAWMKDNDSVRGGTLRTDANAGPLDAEYLAQSVRAFRDALNISPAQLWLAVQNEPTHDTNSYPSMGMNNDYEIAILAILRGRLAQLGLGQVQLIGHEDNFVYARDAALLVKYNSTIVDQVAFHCYNGSYNNLGTYFSTVGTAGQGKRLSMSECTGLDAGKTLDRSGYQWWFDQIFMPLLGADFSSVISWNIALDEGFGPRLPSALCDNCIGTLTIRSDGGAVRANLQSIMLATFAGATADLTRFGGGPAVRLDTQTSSSTGNCITARTFRAPWSSNSSGQYRYGLVVQNTCGDRTLTVSLNGQTADLQFEYGFTAYTWTA